MTTPLKTILNKKISAATNLVVPVGGSDRTATAIADWSPEPRWLPTVKAAAIQAGFAPACPLCGCPGLWVSVLPVVASTLPIIPGSPSPVRVRCGGCDPPKFAGLVRLWVVGVAGVGGWSLEQFKPTKFPFRKRQS
jgi:hypothetical protein